MFRLQSRGSCYSVHLYICHRPNLYLVSPCQPSSSCMYCYRTVLKAHQTVASSCITTSLRHLNAAVQSKSAKNGKHHRHSSGKKVKEPFVDDYFVLKLFKDTDNECLKSIIGYSTFLPERHLGCFSFHTFRDIQNHLQVILHVKLFTSITRSSFCCFL